MNKYRKKPVVVEAVQLSRKNLLEVQEWCGGGPHYDRFNLLDGLGLITLEGDRVARFGDWIIKGVNDEFYPCKPDIFAKTYDPVGSEPTADGLAILHKRYPHTVNSLIDIIDRASEYLHDMQCDELPDAELKELCRLCREVREIKESTD